MHFHTWMLWHTWCFGGLVKSSAWNYHCRAGNSLLVYVLWWQIKRSKERKTRKEEWWHSNSTSNLMNFNAMDHQYWRGNLWKKDKNCWRRRTKEFLIFQVYSVNIFCALCCCWHFMSGLANHVFDRSLLMALLFYELTTSTVPLKL